MEAETGLAVQNSLSCEEMKEEEINVQECSDIKRATEDSLAVAEEKRENGTSTLVANISDSTDDSTCEIVFVGTSKSSELNSNVEKDSEKDRGDSSQAMDTVRENGSNETTDSISCKVQSSEHSQLNGEAIVDNDITMHENNISEKNETTILTTEKNDKISSLGVIALEYENSDSEIEEVSSSSNKQADAPESSEMDVQILSYRVCKNNVLSSDESDSEEDSSSSSSSDCSSISVSNDSDSDDSTNK